MELSHRLFAPRGAAIFATAAIHLAILMLALMSWSRPVTRAAADRLSVFTVSAASPPEPPAPEPAEPKATRIQPRPDDATPIQPIVQLATVVPAPSPPPAAPAIVPPPAPPPSPARIAPPSTPPAPPRQASAPDVDWESRLLAHIDRHKRYPKVIGSRRPNGTAYVLFTMNRAGAILAARIEQSSGNDALDRAALETLRRAAPLPQIPNNRPDKIQLSVPVEFSTA